MRSRWPSATKPSPRSDGRRAASGTQYCSREFRLAGPRLAPLWIRYSSWRRDADALYDPWRRLLERAHVIRAHLMEVAVRNRVRLDAQIPCTGARCRATGRVVEACAASYACSDREDSMCPRHCGRPVRGYSVRSVVDESSIDPYQAARAPRREQRPRGCRGKARGRAQTEAGELHRDVLFRPCSSICRFESVVLLPGDRSRLVVARDLSPSTSSIVASFPSSFSARTTRSASSRQSRRCWRERPLDDRLGNSRQQPDRRTVEEGHRRPGSVAPSAPSRMNPWAAAR